jgi:hypothetical protein
MFEYNISFKFLISTILHQKLKLKISYESLNGCQNFIVEAGTMLESFSIFKEACN